MRVNELGPGIRSANLSAPPRTSHAAEEKRFLIHLEVANGHRLPRAVALARTLMKGGHEVAISYEPQITIRLSPTSTSTIYWNGEDDLRAWMQSSPDIRFFPVDAFCEDSLAGMHRSQQRRSEILGAVIAEYGPDWVLLWGGDFEYQQGSRAAVGAAGLAERTIFFEVAWLPQQEFLYFDLTGVNSRSTLVGFDYPEMSKPQKDALTEAKRRFRASRVGGHGPSPVPGTVFVPMQIETDTNYRIGAPFDSNAEMVRFLEGWLPPKYSATLKLHPKERIRGCPVSSARRNFRVVASGSLDRLMAPAEFVLGLNSTVLIEAAMLGKPVIALGRGIFTGSGAVLEAGIDDDAGEVLARETDAEARDRFLYELFFRRQVSFAALQRGDYGHLITREPFASIIKDTSREVRRSRFLDKLVKGESMISIGRSRIAKSAVLDVERGGQIIIGDDSEVRHNAVLEVSGRYNGTIRIGNHSVIGVGSWLQGSGKIEIGDDVIIGPYAAIVSTNHQYDDTSIPVARRGLDVGEIVIEDDVWLGAHVTLAQNVRIGAHSIIGANSFVNSDIPPYSIAVGSPARVIKQRET